MSDSAARLSANHRNCSSSAAAPLMQSWLEQCAVLIGCCAELMRAYTLRNPRADAKRRSRSAAARQVDSRTFCTGQSLFQHWCCLRLRVNQSILRTKRPWLNCERRNHDESSAAGVTRRAKLPRGFAPQSRAAGVSEGAEVEGQEEKDSAHNRSSIKRSSFNHHPRPWPSWPLCCPSWACRRKAYRPRPRSHLRRRRLHRRPSSFPQ